MKKLIQASLLFYLCFSFSNVNAAYNLDWVNDTTAYSNPTGVSYYADSVGAFGSANDFQGPNTVQLEDTNTGLFGNATFTTSTYLDLSFKFVDNSTPIGAPSIGSTLTLNKNTNFTITSILFNGTDITSLLGSLLNPNGMSLALVGGVNTFQILGKVNYGGTNNNLDLRITATPIPAAVWLFGSALLGIGALSSRRKSLTAKSLVA